MEGTVLAPNAVRGLRIRDIDLSDMPKKTSISISRKYTEKRAYKIVSHTLSLIFGSKSLRVNWTAYSLGWLMCSVGVLADCFLFGSQRYRGTSAWSRLTPVVCGDEFGWRRWQWMVSPVRGIDSVRSAHAPTGRESGPPARRRHTC